MADGHQFQRPSSATVEGTSTVRTTKVSSRMPTARPKPIASIWLLPGPFRPEMARTANVPARTRPAEVTVGPVAPTARITASRNGRWAASSRILVITKML